METEINWTTIIGSSFFVPAAVKAHKRAPSADLPKEKPLKKAAPAIVAETLEERTMEPEQIFSTRLEKLSKFAHAGVYDLPPPNEILQYVAQLSAPDQPPWYRVAQEALVAADCRYPVTTTLTRDYIAPFLIQHHPRLNGKFRPCCQPANQCVSQKYGGFTLPELVLPDQLVIDPAQRPHGMCYLCHLSYTNGLYWKALSSQKTLEDRELFVIHYFNVYTDRIGEYRLSHTLLGEEEYFQGIFGPFPVWNPDYYAVVEKGPLKAWREDDRLVFRLPQVVSETNECSPSTRME